MNLHTDYVDMGTSKIHNLDWRILTIFNKSQTYSKT